MEKEIKKEEKAVFLKIIFYAKKKTNKRVIKLSLQHVYKITETYL